MKLTTKGLLLVLLPLIIQIVFVIGLMFLLAEGEKDLARELHSKQIMEQVQEVTRDALQAYTSMLMRWSPLKSAHVQIAAKKLTDLNTGVEALSVLTRTDPVQTERVNKLKTLTSEFTLIMKAYLSAPGEEYALYSPLSAVSQRFMVVSAKALSAANEIGAAEAVVASRKHKERIANRKRLNQMILAGCVFDMVAAAVIAAVFYTTVSTRFIILFDNTLKLSRKQVLNAPLKGRDEIAAIDASFHKMAESIEKYQHRLLSTLDQLGVGVAVINLDCQPATVEFVNAELVSLFELDGSNVTSETAAALLGPVGTTAQELLTQAEVADGMVTCEYRLPSGRGGYAEVTVRPDHSTGRNQAIVCIRDVTDQKKVEQLKNQFLAMISHELRTPLSAAKLFLSLLIEDTYSDSAELKKRAASQLRNMDRLISLTNGLLQIEKMEAEASDLFMEPLKVRELLNDVSEAVSGVVSNFKVSVTVTVEPPDCQVVGDYEK